MVTKKDKEILREFIFYAFTFAWNSELLLIAAYQFHFMQGRPGMFLHYLLIIMGPGLAPVYAAYIVRKKYEGVTFSFFFRRIFYTKHVYVTIILTIVFACIQFASCVVLEKYRGYPWYWFIFFVPLMVLGGGLEEIGWRSVLQIQLEKCFSFRTSAVVEGILWSLWHIPLWFVPDTFQKNYSFTAFTLYCIVLGCTLAVAYRLTSSIFACILIHAWGNTTVGGMYTLTSLTDFPCIRTILVYMAQIALLAIVYKIYRAVYFSRKKKSAVLEVTGSGEEPDSHGETKHSGF
jgi:uncharacterized protein